MMQEDDGWEDVNDPVEIKKMMGVKGVQELVKQTKAGANGPADDTQTAPSGLSAAQLKAWQKGRASLETLKLLNGVRRTYDKDFNTAGPAGISDYNPFSTKNQALDGKIAAMLGPAKAAYRTDGEGAFSDTDITLLRDSLPSRWSFDSKNQESMKSMDEILRGHIRTGFGAAGLSAEDIGKAASAEEYKAEGADNSVNEVLQEMLQSGKYTPEQIVQYLKDQGSDPTGQEEAIRADLEFRKAYPGYDKPRGNIPLPIAPPAMSGATQRPDADALRKKYGLQ